MSEAKFTKREWAVITEPESEHYLTTVDCGGVMQLNVITSATDITFAESFERRANANLIAAAPEMYEMLDEVLNVLGHELNPTNKSYIKAIKELLAKARGEHD